MHRKITAAITAVALIVSAVAVATPADARWRHHHHGGWGGGAALGGFAAGAILGGALAAQRPYYGYGYAPGPVYYDAGPGYYGGDATGYCMQRFKSYDPASGTYLGYDGYRHPCP